MLGAVLTEESFAIDIVGEVGQFASGARDSRPILVPDTAINTLGLLGQLQQAAGRPVITANQASLWHAARLVGKASANVLDDFAGLLDRVSG